MCQSKYHWIVSTMQIFWFLKCYRIVSTISIITTIWLVTETTVTMAWMFWSWLYFQHHPIITNTEYGLHQLLMYRKVSITTTILLIIITSTTRRVFWFYSYHYHWIVPTMQISWFPKYCRIVPTISIITTIWLVTETTVTMAWMFWPWLWYQHYPIVPRYQYTSLHVSMIPSMKLCLYSIVRYYNGSSQ